jgi:lysozyme
MKASQNFLNFIGSPEIEGDKLTAYPDPKTGGAPWTIGKGHTGPDVHPGMKITQQQSDDFLRADVTPIEVMIADAFQVKLTQAQFDMLVSIIYNVGPGSKFKDGIIRLKNGSPSTLRRKLNTGDYQGAADAFLSWISPGSNVENGLRKRRTKERAIFLNGWPND